jgi:P27 family predicted phage terminase small subunit
MRGRKPTSRQLQLVRGTYRPHRHRNSVTVESQGAPLDPTAPADLTEAQAAIWTDTLAAAPQGLLFESDRQLVRSYVVAVDMHRQASKRLAREPLVRKGSRSQVVDPLVQIVSRQSTLILSLSDSLGFSPASRARLCGPTPKAKRDPAEEFFD